MSLLTYRAPVSYTSQLSTCGWRMAGEEGKVAAGTRKTNQLGTRAAGFENFLQEFKTSPEQAITQGLGNIAIGDDDLSDDYDFMDEDDEAAQRRQQERARQKGPRYKYKEMLRELADRKIDEVVIELDDLAAVICPRSSADSNRQC